MVSWPATVPAPGHFSRRQTARSCSNQLCQRSVVAASASTCPAALVVDHQSVGLRGASSSRATDALDEQDQTAEQHHRTANQRVEISEIDQTPRHDHDRQNRYRQPLLSGEHADQFGKNFVEHGHCAISTLILRARVEPTRPAARKRAANSSNAKSCPGQATPSPSPVQNTPKADSMTPTPNLRVFSGTRDNGRWMMAPAARTSAQAASAPRLAGISSPRQAPTAITINTTSRPSSSTALSAVIPATQSRLLCWRPLC